MDFSTLVVRFAIAFYGIVLPIGLITVGISVRRYRRDERTSELQPVITAELFDRLGEDDPDWETWVAGLSVAERVAARSVAERLLRQLRGAERRELGRLAFALGIDRDRLRQDIESGDLYPTLRALTWLALVEYPSVVDAAIDHCTWDRTVRSALARVLYENDDPRASRTGVDLLLGGGTEPLSVFGLDTLYRIARRDPSHLLERADDDHGTWSDPVLVQVLVAVRHGGSAIGPTSIAWVLDCLYRDPEVQAEALLLLGEYGWSPRIREAVDLGAFCTHPEPTVRQAAYVALGEWGGDELESAAESIRDEPDDLARLVGIRVLRANGLDAIDEPSETFARTRQWALAERRALREAA